MDENKNSRRIISYWKSQSLFRSAWNAFRRTWPQLIAGQIVLAIIFFAGGVTGYFFFFKFFPSKIAPLVFLGLFFLFFLSLIFLGMSKIAVKGVVEMKASIGDLFGGWRDAWKYMTALLVYTVISVVINFVISLVIFFFGRFVLGFMLGTASWWIFIFILTWPFLYQLIRFGFFPYFIADQGMGPFEALKASYAGTADYKWAVTISWLMVLGISLANGLIPVVGSFASAFFPHAVPARISIHFVSVVCSFVAVALSNTILARTYVSLMLDSRPVEDL
ncbi:MAG: hypothetical protein HY541_04555 [Deltaproteobacteria bacterium]|nr:hypothetical protein [Deltaproteobacteria bacterium]